MSDEEKIDQAVLGLTNCRQFYELVVPKLKIYAKSANPQTTIEAIVYRARKLTVGYHHVTRRTVGGIENRLAQRIWEHYKEEVTGKPTQTDTTINTSTTQEKEEMSIKSIKVESILYIVINDERREASEVKDHQIFNYIKQLEFEITELQEIKAQPKTLKAEIERLDAEIKALVEFVDSRDTK